MGQVHRYASPRGEGSKLAERYFHLERGFWGLADRHSVEFKESDGQWD